MTDHEPTQLSPWRAQLHEVIFEADTPAGRLFDIALLVAILASILAVMLESVSSIRINHGTALRVVEWVFTILFTVEYTLRLISVRKPLAYASSFYGIVDLLAILPTYLSLFIAGTHSLLVIRALRLLRAFRVLKLVHMFNEAQVLVAALKASRDKIIVFMGTVLAMVVILASLMYLIEGPEHGFTSIPRSAYWAIVTLTTVGYGDIAPQTVLGQALATIVMFMGYAIIVVPTGIVSAEIAQARVSTIRSIACPACGLDVHYPDSVYCRGCGAQLETE